MTRDILEYLGISAGIVIISCMAITLIMNIFYPAPNPVLINCTPKITYIYSLETGNQVKGSFFLGIGSIKDRMYYYFYRDSDYKGYTLDKIEIQEYMFAVSLIENDSLRPQLREYGGQYCKDNPKGAYRYELIVPSNTIKKSYNGMVSQ